MLIIKKHLTLRPDLNPDFGPIAGTAEGGKLVSRRLSRGLVQQTLLIWLLSAVAALAVGATAYVTLRHSGNADSGPAERPFTASDFKWPTLIEHLNDGSLGDAVNTDEAVFILYYLKEMNAVFGDPDMKVFIDAQCFTKVFDAEMSARLQSMFWTKVMPKAVWELGALIKDDRAISESLASRFVASTLRGPVHFRPKSEYWWLAYCYDNYTFSCQICNQTYKGNQFPIEGKKLPQPKLPASLPTDQAKLAKIITSLCPDPAKATDAAVKKLLSAEDANLPNPYLVDPEQLFAWKVEPDTEEVWIVAKGSSARAKRAGKAAESVLGLNRTELLRLRWNHYDELETLALALQEGNFTDAKKRARTAHSRP
jgi:hypothetical protein